MARKPLELGSVPATVISGRTAKELGLADCPTDLAPGSDASQVADRAAGIVTAMPFRRVVADLGSDGQR